MLYILVKANERTAPESVRVLNLFPACTVTVGQPEASYIIIKMANFTTYQHALTFSCSQNGLQMLYLNLNILSENMNISGFSLSQI